MRSNHSVGRHRKSGPARAIATRTAVSTGAAVAAVLMAGGPATAAASTGVAAANAPATVESAPAAEPPCTGTALDAIVGPLTGANCNANPEDDDPTNPGGPNTPDDNEGGAPPVGGTPGAPPISCTGTPLDAFTTCATGGHGQRGSDRGDATGADTPSLGSGDNDQGQNPPAG